MSISKAFSKYNGRSWLSDIVASTPTLSKKRSGKRTDYSPYKNGSGSIRSISCSSPMYPIITGGTGGPTYPGTPSYPIVTSTRQRSSSTQRDRYADYNYPMLKSSTLKPRKALHVIEFENNETPIISSKPEWKNKKHSAPPALQYGSQFAHDAPDSQKSYDSVDMGTPISSKVATANKTTHVGHYKKKEQKKTFVDSGCKTLDRNHFSRIRVSYLSQLNYV